MSRNNVDKASLIQLGGLYDNAYLVECVRRYPGRFSAVVNIDTRSNFLCHADGMAQGKHQHRCANTDAAGPSGDGTGYKVPEFLRHGGLD